MILKTEENMEAEEAQVEQGQLSTKATAVTGRIANYFSGHSAVTRPKYYFFKILARPR
jgi:hypothetical protein